MSRLFLPPKVVRELKEQTRQNNADLERVCHSDATCREWTKELSRLDPVLCMVKAPDRPVLGLPLVAGAYHILNKGRHGAPWSVIPITTPDGKPCPPPGRLLDQLKSQDLQNPTVERMRERIQRETQASEERRRERETEQRQEEILDRWKAASMTRINFDPERKWTQTVNGKRGQRKD